MKRTVSMMALLALFVALFSGCGSSADYEIVSEDESEVSQTGGLSAEVSAATETTDLEELRGIAASIRDERGGYDLVNVVFSEDGEGENPIGAAQAYADEQSARDVLGEEFESIRETLSENDYVFVTTEDDAPDDRDELSE